MRIRTIDWKNNKVRLIDQTRLPEKLIYLEIGEAKDLWHAIKVMQVRGAPALGAAAALGVYLGIRRYHGDCGKRFERRFDLACDYIAGSRPTARNLFWGLERVKKIAASLKGQPISKIKNAILEEAKQIMREDMLSCRRIGAFGQKLLKSGDRILTICNAGILATIDYGTALGVIYAAKKSGKKINVFSCETRPLLQGARLTCWELNKNGVEVTMIADNTAAHLMKEGRIDAVIAGADRIAANADSANKIGTLNLAILARHHRLPFYIAAPESTFDLSLKEGNQIKIEMRKTQEVTKILLQKNTAPGKTKTLNPAFDVTPHKLISAIITDRGIIKMPFGKNIKRLFG